MNPFNTTIPALGRLMQGCADPVHFYFIQAEDEEGNSLDLMVRASSVGEALKDFHQVYYGEQEDLNNQFDVVMDMRTATPEEAIAKDLMMISRILPGPAGPVMWHDPDCMIFEGAFTMIHIETEDDELEDL